MIKELKKQVEYILKNYGQPVRDSDIQLMIELWQEFYPEELISTTHAGRLVSLNNLFNLPTQDNIKRIRAKIQNEEHRFLPSLEVFLGRARESRAWQKELGYNKIWNTPEDLAKLAENWYNKIMTKGEQNTLL